MCSRYGIDDGTIKEIKKIVRKTDGKMERIQLGEVAPSQPAVVITGRGLGMKLEVMRWGFLPYSGTQLLINARAETVLERKMFRESVLRRRCVIPAKQFYEWDPDKNKVTFSQKEGPVLYMAGFYNQFNGDDRFIILTTAANSSVRPVHDRMPLILEEAELQKWIYDPSYLNQALAKTPPLLSQFQEYEQQRLFFPSCSDTEPE